MSAHRIGRRQLQGLRATLSERDLAVLSSLRRYRLMTVEQVQRLHFHTHASTETGQRVCRRTLLRLTERDLVARLERRIGGVRAGSAGHVHALSPLGHRLLDTTTRQRHREPSFAFVQHTLAITELATQLVTRAADAALDVLLLDPEPAAWRPFHDGATAVTLKPDLALQLADDHYEASWFVEIDCGTESRPTLQRKCQTYDTYWRTGIEQREHGIFPQTLWIAPDESRARLIGSAIETATNVEPALFAVTTGDRALDVLTDLSGEATRP